MGSLNNDHMNQQRRGFIKVTGILAAATMLMPKQTFSATAPKKMIRVLVWDERQPAAQQAYDGGFLGNKIATHLSRQTHLEVKSAGLDDPDQGLSSETLRNTDVLIWWGHIRHAEVPIAKAQEIAELISNGSLCFIGLHSAHWSNPFIEAMNAITKQRILAQKDVKPEELEFVVAPEIRKALPLPTQRVAPYNDMLKFPDGSRKIIVHLPNCCFPKVSNDGKPSVLKTQVKSHPILKGLPATLTLKQTEMYGEPFHVPEPDELLLEEYWEDGEWFRSAMLWRLGKGKVFYFRPGHEGYPIFKEPWVLQLLTNAVSWLGGVKP